MVSIGPVRSGTDNGEELFDLLTPDDVPLNKTKSRSHVHRDGDWHASVHIWLLHRHTGQLLLQRRAPNKDSYPDRWDVSCAGHLSAGETPTQAAIAELNEELGVSAYVVNDGADMTSEQIIAHVQLSETPDFNNDTHHKSALYHVCRYPRTQVSQHGKFIDREHTDIYICITDRSLDQFTLQQDEVSDVQYVEVDKFVSVQQSADQCEELKYVPISEFDMYHKNVFTIVTDVQQYIVAHKR